MTLPTKPSALSWATSIPRHWDSAKVCLVARLESGHTPSRQRPEYWIPEQCTIPWFSLADVWQLREANQKYLGDTAEKISPLGVANSAARVLPAGTVVLSRTASVGFSGIMPRPMATTQDFANWVCGPRLLPEYLLWAFRAMKPEFARMMMGSTHQTIYMPDIRRLAIPVPPRAEQRAIADFLDRKTAAIDVVVTNRQAMLAALDERRQRLIDDLDEYSSGPLVRLKWFVDLLPGYAFPSEGFVAPEAGIRLLRGVNVTPGGVCWDDAVAWPHQDARNLAEYALDEGDLVFGMDRPWVSNGLRLSTVRSADLPSLLLQRVARLRAREGLDQEYLRLILLASRFRGYFEPLMTGISVPHVSPEQILAYSFRLPASDVQKAAVQRVRSEEVRTESIARIVVQLVTSLREHRDALITAAVTGQLDLAAQEAA